MLLCYQIIFISISWICIKNIWCTIDLNAAELQYLSDHLTREECRTLVAAAHLKGYEEPNVLDQVGKYFTKKRIFKALPD